MAPPNLSAEISSLPILLDATWTARVSDHELSYIVPENRCDDLVMGTFGYLTFEQIGFQKRLMCIELLTGKTPIFMYGECGDTYPLSVVDFAVPAILAGELVKILNEADTNLCVWSC